MSSQEDEAKLAKQRERKEAAERKAADEEYSRQAQAVIRENLSGKYRRKPFTPEEQAYIDDLEKRFETEQDPEMRRRIRMWIGKRYMGFQRTFEEFSAEIDELRKKFGITD